MAGAQLVVGLGNPGPAYRPTRHNLGQAVVDELGRRLEARLRLQGPAVLAALTWGGAPLYLAKPVAFMNAVGPAIRRLLGSLALDPSALIVVYDDLDLPFGTVRIRHQGRHGGHNGMRSLLEALGTEAVRRVKVGVGRPASRDEVVDWLLTPFTEAERQALPAVLARAADATLRLVKEGNGP